MGPLKPSEVAFAIRCAWTAEIGHGAGSRYLQRQTVGEHMPIRGRRVYVAPKHIVRAWTVAELPDLGEAETYGVNAHAGRMN